MRTTLTLEPDVAHLLKDAMRREGITLKAAVNGAIRTAFSGIRPQPKRKKYVMKTYDLGYRGDILPSKMLAKLEEEDFLRKIREGR